MAQASRLPVMPAAVFYKRRTIENLPGIHVIYDTPVRFCQGMFPTYVFDGVTVSFLLYTERDPVLFRLYVGMNLEKSHFMEMGVFNDAGYTGYGNCLAYKTQPKLKEGEIIEKSNVAIPEPHQYVWVEFSFSGTKTTQFYCNSALLGTHSNLEIGYFNSYMIWQNKAINNVTVLEVHATYYPSASSTLFSPGKPVNVTDNGNIRVGGRLVVVGNFKRTSSQSDDIQFQVQTPNKTAQICTIKRPSQDDMTIVFERRATRLICQVGNKAEWKLEDYEMDTTTAISLVQNFEVRLIRQFTGMSMKKDFVK
ncbi:uncharacterized protein LOC135370745 [Ornithodoros turicata]|uniref:uncharacterized protein LOC135370745 n=1 Tax=Ornithodoros turicata TaxID=34597 RepID=UPI003138F4AA